MGERTQLENIDLSKLAAEIAGLLKDVPVDGVLQLFLTEHAVRQGVLATFLRRQLYLIDFPSDERWLQIEYDTKSFTSDPAEALERFITVDIVVNAGQQFFERSASVSQEDDGTGAGSIQNQRL